VAATRIDDPAEARELDYEQARAIKLLPLTLPLLHRAQHAARAENVEVIA